MTTDYAKEWKNKSLAWTLFLLGGVFLAFGPPILSALLTGDTKAPFASDPLPLLPTFAILAFASLWLVFGIVGTAITKDLKIIPIPLIGTGLSTYMFYCALFGYSVNWSVILAGVGISGLIGLGLLNTLNEVFGLGGGSAASPDETIRHYDSKGNYTGYSERWGNTTSHYDREGRYIGRSENE